MQRRIWAGMVVALACMSAAWATEEINLGKTSLATVSGSLINGGRQIDNPYYGVLNLFDEGRHFINGLNYDYWLGDAGGAPQWVEVRFDVPVTVSSMTILTPTSPGIVTPTKGMIPPTEEWMNNEAFKWMGDYGVVTEDEAGAPMHESLPPVRSEYEYLPQSEAGYLPEKALSPYIGAYASSAQTITIRLFAADGTEVSTRTFTTGNTYPLGSIYDHVTTKRAEAPFMTEGGPTPTEGALTFTPAVPGVTRARLEVSSVDTGSVFIPHINEWYIMGSVPDGTAFTFQPPHLTRTAESSAELARISCPEWIVNMSAGAGTLPKTVETDTAFVTTYSNGTLDLARISVDKATGEVTCEELVTVTPVS
jgi:hypothetical protein